MNLSMVFLVLSLFIGYLLYDMFKKSRQQQELAQIQSVHKPASRLKPSYQTECALLHQLHEQKMEQLKHKQVSIHLDQAREEPLSESQTQRILSILKQLSQTHRIYILVSRGVAVRNPLVQTVKQAGATEIGFQTTEGAIAALRQLSCGTHLEGSEALGTILQQYLAVWVVGGKGEGSGNFRTEFDMLANLEYSLHKPKLE